MTPLHSIVREVRSKRLEQWLAGYARHLAREVFAPRVAGRRHLLFCICDHYEPLWGAGTSDAQGDARVRAWEERYPQLAAGYRDAGGRPPRYTFFFPGEQYRPQFLERLARLARAGLGEVELHLHHDGDTEQNLRADIASYLQRFAAHGHVSRDGERYRYAFIHGNWCLANARADGRWCGVDAELPLLFDTGCYADFTFPSAPDECQPNIVNQLYWPVGDLARRRAYEQGERARVGQAYWDRLLLVQGPLCLAPRWRAMPVRIEASHLTDVDPPTPTRVARWVRQNIHVAGRPEWVFVKVHTHGAPEPIADALLGAGGHALHAELGRCYNDGARWVLHYVTARELYNIAIAAMEGRTGDPEAYRDHVIPPPPVAAG